MSRGANTTSGSAARLSRRRSKPPGLPENGVIRSDLGMFACPTPAQADGGIQAAAGCSADLAEKSMVDSRRRACRSNADTPEDGVASYAKVGRSRLISSADISAIFGKPPTWFSRHRNRAPLEQRGFPKPIIRGRWLRTAVEAWLEREGRRTRLSSNHVPGPQGEDR